MNNSKLLVGCPTSDHKRYCLKEYAAAVKALDYSNYEILLVDNSKSDFYIEEIKRQGLTAVKGPWHEGARDRIVASRNLLREYFLQHDFDCLLSLEQDVIPEPDIINRLLAHSKDIVSGLVYNNLPWSSETDYRMLPMVWVQHPKDPEGLWYASEEELKAFKLMNAKAVSLSCVLISRKVLEKIKFRYAGSSFDDMMFSKDAISEGFKLFVDTTVKPKHLHGSWEGVRK